jgi:gluconolactonase
MAMQLRPASAALLGAMATCLACTSSAPDQLDGRNGEDGAIGDGAQVEAGPAPSELDGSVSAPTDGSVRDGSPTQLDATAPMEAGQTASDGGARDAASPSVDAGSGQSLRAKVCGTEQNYASPLPPQGQRTAQPIGTMSFGFLEGPLWLAESGVLLFSDMDMSGSNAMGPPATIRRLTPPAMFSVFAPSSNGNGLALYTDGRVLAATHDNQGLSWFDSATGAKTPIAVQAGGKSLNSPNDLAVRSDGTVYFTDPNYQRGSARPEVTKVTGLYRLQPPLMTSGTNEAFLLDGTLTQPNGVALSPDEKTLYVGSSGAEIWKFSVAADGSLSNRTKFAEPGASDGLTVDCAGNLYVTSGEVEVFAPDGMRLGGIAVGGSPTNVAFGDADRKTLYITAGARLYSIRLNVPGFPY